MREYLTLDEAADRLEVDLDTARELVRSGQIPGTWVPERSTWYVRPGDVDAFRAAAQ